MNRFYPIVLISITLLLLTALEGRGATFSGRVVDGTGAPVSGLKLVLPETRVTTPQDQEPPMLLPSHQTETDEKGEFKVAGITAPAVRLMLLPMHEATHEIQAITIDGVSFHLDNGYGGHPLFGGFTFGISPEADIADVEITVQPRMRIRGRVLFEDGTPLRNTRVRLQMQRRSLGGGSGSSSGISDLDADGYFVEYVQNPMHYTVTVIYGGQSATSEERLIKAGEQHDDLVLTLAGKPPDEPEQAEVRPEPMVDVEAERARFEAAFDRDRAGMWAINPENRHAYKRIHADSPEEARKRATEEGAHLVTINDAAEQTWLLNVFQKENFWIGTTDTSDAENPRWDNGEPLTYTNWLDPEAAEGGTENYVVLIGMTGKWQIARDDSPLFRLTERALLEKSSFVPEPPE